MVEGLKWEAIRSDNIHLVAVKRMPLTSETTGQVFYGSASVPAGKMVFINCFLSGITCRLSSHLVVSHVSSSLLYLHQPHHYAFLMNLSFFITLLPLLRCHSTHTQT